MLFVVTQRVVVNTSLLIEAKSKEDAKDQATEYTEGRMAFTDRGGSIEATVSEVETTNCVTQELLDKAKQAAGLVNEATRIGSCSQAIRRNKAGRITGLRLGGGGTLPVR